MFRRFARYATPSHGKHIKTKDAETTAAEQGEFVVLYFLMYSEWVFGGYFQSSLTV